MNIYFRPFFTDFYPTPTKGFVRYLSLRGKILELKDNLLSLGEGGMFHGENLQFSFENYKKKLLDF